MDTEEELDCAALLHEKMRSGDQGTALQQTAGCPTDSLRNRQGLANHNILRRLLSSTSNYCTLT
ncbi:hypothetical protein INR49_032401, partial [Caranx melampygus]